MTTDSVSLRDFVERIFDEREKALAQHTEALRREVESKAVALANKLEEMNQFRAQVREERIAFASLTELKALCQRVEKLEKTHEAQAGAASVISWGWGVLVMLLSIAGSTVVAWLTR